MKYIILFLSFFYCVTIYSQAENDSQTAKIYFIRTTGFIGSYVGMKTFIDSDFKCNLTNDRFKIYDVQSGRHTFSAQLKGEILKPDTERFELNIEPNHTYYIQIILETGTWANKLYCEEITENTATRKILKLKEDEKCD